MKPAQSARPNDSRARATSADLALAHAVALQAAGEARPAIAVLEAAHRTRPGDREIVATLAAFLAGEGDVAAALRYAERWLALAPDDPDAEALVRRLRGGP